ncbi:MAG: M48 family metallopeptidase [Pigmentiphaga sp.]|nr:M48 family metallopeptidase [Pigmentiphaga sp.]
MAPTTPKPGRPDARPPSPPTPTAPAPRTAGQLEVVFDGVAVPYLLRRSRRRTIGLSVGESGLRVTAPTWVGGAEIERLLHERRDWILRHLQNWKERREHWHQHGTRWENGGRLPYLGATIEMRTSGNAPTHFAGALDQPAEGDVLWLALPADASAERIRDSVQAWLRQRAQAVLGDRLQAALARTGLSIAGWRLSSAATRWGSCSSSGRIRLNWRLVHFAPHLIDYVIIHELAHLREMNHGPGFWAQVETLMPDYRSAREALRAIDPGVLPDF